MRIQKVKTVVSHIGVFLMFFGTIFICLKAVLTFFIGNIDENSVLLFVLMVISAALVFTLVKFDKTGT